MVSRALASAGVRPSELSAVAVTVGPGLSLCLRVGVLEARRLCAENGVPMIPVHHMEVPRRALDRAASRLLLPSSAAAAGARTVMASHLLPSPPSRPPACSRRRRTPCSPA